MKIGRGTSRWSVLSSDDEQHTSRAEQSRPPGKEVPVVLFLLRRATDPWAEQAAGRGPGAEATASRRALRVEEVLDDHGVLDLEPIARSQRVGAAVGDEVGGCRGGRRQRLKVEVEVEVNPREEVSADGGDGMGHMGGWRIWIRVGRPARLKVWRG